MSTPRDHVLGEFLKDRRAKLDPQAFGFAARRRRTPGLRREEVAQRAEISTTWYTWLEQGRGGAPSAEVLERLADALKLTTAEREHLFLLAQSRPPGIGEPTPASVSPRLQRVLDALPFSPAFIKTPTWDLIAWNRAATVVLTDYGALPPQQRNLLRLLFSADRLRAKMPHWEHHARFAVATFRLETARAGLREAADALVHELSQTSPEFAAMWRDNEVRNHGAGTKQVLHPIAGSLEFEYSAFAVDDQPDLVLVVYTPARLVDLERVQSLLKA